MEPFNFQIGYHIGEQVGKRALFTVNLLVNSRQLPEEGLVVGGPARFRQCLFKPGELRCGIRGRMRP